MKNPGSQKRENPQGHNKGKKQGTSSQLHNLPPYKKFKNPPKDELWETPALWLHISIRIS